MMCDLIFYISSFILICAGFNYFAEIFNITNSIFQKIIHFTFGVLYIVVYFKHRHNQARRLDEMIHKVENKYIDKTIRRNDKMNQ